MFIAAKVTAEALVTIGISLRSEGGMEAMKMRVAEDLIECWGGIAKKSSVMIVSSDIGDISKVIGTALKIVDRVKVSA